MSDVQDLSSPVVGQITLRYWAAAGSAAGVDSEIIDVAGPVLLSDLVADARARHSQKFGEILACCSMLVGDRPANLDIGSVSVRPGESVEFLPPFAGG